MKFFINYFHKLQTKQSLFWLAAILFSSLIAEAQSVVKSLPSGVTTIAPNQIVCYDMAFATPDKGANHSYTNITIVDVLDPRFEYVSSTGANNFNNGSFSGGSVTWTAPTLDDGSAGSFQVCVRLKNGAAANGDNILNQVTFKESGTTTATSGTPNITVIDVLPNVITFTKIIFSGGGDIVLDQPITYEIKACNTGGVTNTNFSVTDYIPAGAQILFADGGTVSGNTITWTEGPDANFNNRTYIDPPVCWKFSPTILFPSSAFSASDPTSKFKNSADGTGTPGTGTPITYPQVSTEPGAIVAPNYVMETEKKGNFNVSVGYQGSFNFEFSNTGNASIQNLTITDPIPPQVKITEIAGLKRGSTPRANFSYKINGQPTVYTYAPISTTDRNTYTPVSAFLPNPATDYISEVIFTFIVDIFAGTSQNDYVSPTVRYETLANTHPYIVSGGTEVASASVPVATPSDFTNTASYTSTSPLTIPDASKTVYVNEKAPIPKIDKLLSKVLETYGDRTRAYGSSTAENVSPSDTVEYVLRVTNDDNATDYLKNFTLTDVLPAGVTYVPNSWLVVGASQVSTTNGTYNGIVPTIPAQIPAADYDCSNSLMTYYEAYGNNTTCNLAQFSNKALIMPQPTFTQSGQNLAWTWDWEAWYNNYSGPNPASALYGGDGYATSIFIKFKAVVKPTVTTGATINNNFTLTSPQTNSPLTSNNTVQTVLRKASLSSKKTVQGSLDASLASAGSTIPGGTADYCIRVYNDGNVPMKNVRVVDVLPYINDIKVLSDVPRVNPGASDWRPILNAAIVPPTGVTVMYSTVTKPCLSGITAANANPISDLVGCNTPNFSSTPPVDLSTVQTIEFDFGTTVINPGDSVKLCWKMKAPVDALVNQLAWNSFAYVADYADGSTGGLLASEPPPVSLIVQCPRMTGSSVDTTICSGAKPINMFVDTDFSEQGGVNFVYFNTPQTGTTMYTGGTSLGTVTGNGARATLGIAATFPTNTTTSPVTYYVYSIVNPTPLNMGCRVSQEIQVTVNPQIVLEASVTQPTCTVATGSITISNFPSGVIYSFDGGTTYGTSPTRSELTPGTYQVRVKNAAGCESAVTPIIIDPQPNAPAAPTASASQPTCAVATGIITVSNPTTGVTYSFDNGANYGTSASSTALAAGTYQVRVKNADGCESSATPITINPQPATPTITIVNAVCSSDLSTYTVTFTSDGTVTSSLGTVDNTAKTVSGITAGVNVTLTATLGTCTKEASVTAPDCNCPTVTAPTSGGDKTICAGDVIPALTVTVGMGESANWYIDGTLVKANSLSFTPTNAGTYSVEAYNTTSNCKSAGKTDVKLTITSKPTITAVTPKCSVTGLTYNVKFTASTGSTVTASDGTVQGDSVINITAGTNVKLVVTANGCKDSVVVTSPICTVPKGSIGDYVWLDNGDNVQGTGDSPIKDLKVYLLNATGTKIDSTFTGTDGKYLFSNLPLGTYSVQFVAPAGQSFVTANQGGNTALDSDAGVDGKSAQVTLTVTNKDILSLDAGLKQKYGSIGNYVWNDFNKDGKQDTSEQPIVGVKVYLLNAVGTKIDSTTTNTAGIYLFDSLIKGDYQVQFVKPVGFNVTVKDNTGDDTNDSDADVTTGKSPIVSIDPDKSGIDRDNLTIDAGFSKVCVKPAAGTDKKICAPTSTFDLIDAIGTQAWIVQGNNPTGSAINTTTGVVTGMSTVGVYNFILSDGFDCADTVKVTVSAKPTITVFVPACSVDGSKYSVEYTASAGTVSTSAGTVDTGTSKVIDVPTGMNIIIKITSVNGCVDSVKVTAPDCVTPKGSIGDYVFLDKDNSGTQTTGDTPIVGVKVYLLNAAGTKIDSTTTGSDGKYLFSNLPLGTYSVQFVAPAGQSFVTPNTGTDPAIDSDAGVNGKTSPITLTTTTPNVTNIDAGLVPIATPVFDLAIRKDLLGTGPFKPGDNVIFNVTVFNQGTVSAYNVEVTDYIPAGTILSDATWAAAGVNATKTLAGPIASNSSRYFGREDRQSSLHGRSITKKRNGERYLRQQEPSGL